MEGVVGEPESVMVDNSETNLDSSSEKSADEIEQLRFKDYLDRAFEKRKNCLFDLEAYMLTSFIIDNNSDFHVMWNFRREILLHWKTHGVANDVTKIRCRDYFEGFSDHELFSILDSVQSNLMGKSETIDFDKIFIDELSFTTKCLTRHLKSYATWHHRTTIIKWMKKPPLESELNACADFFSLDPRNFHCWNYRKFICELLYGPDAGITNQLNFIKSMIKKNPDNFSAFHYQSVLFNHLKEKGSFMAGDGSSLDNQNVWNDEFNSIKSSLLNISSLQGLWLYFWWLCLMRFDIQKSESSKLSDPIVHRIILDNDARILFYQFNYCLRQHPFNEITLIERNGDKSTHTINEWLSIGQLPSDILYHKIDEKVNCENIDEITFNYLGETHLIKLPPLNQSNLSFSTINELPKSRFDLIRQTQSIDWFNDISENSKDSQVIMESNRYFTLTKALLLGGSCKESIAIDPLRRNFYNDLQSRHTIENKLRENQLESQLNLQNLSLTCIHPTSKLTHLRSLDLSNNQLTRINGCFNSLIALQSLILDNNYIPSIDQSFKLVSLKKLSLKKNRLTEKSSIKACNNCEQLTQIIISDNVIANLDPTELLLEPYITIES
ncbi:geranylgeranyl transferase type-2 subunit alpha-like [Panonychus citri]|uniref:geranylgeranyl transferase type-2 subunit alpha-like n=1 Tax=Panonychus citri TaxID=50023 RepID=UPI002307E025|nr:geranylgeranyl transferase type-2 subunit alpha-like [Panonychus citri]